MLGLLRHCVYLQHDFPEDFGLNLLVSLHPYDKQLVNHTFGKGLHQSQSPTPGQGCFGPALKLCPRATLTPEVRVGQAPCIPCFFMYSKYLMQVIRFPLQLCGRHSCYQPTAKEESELQSD